MSHKHATQLRSIFHDPISANIHWREVESLETGGWQPSRRVVTMSTVGDGVVGRGGRIARDLERVVFYGTGCAGEATGGADIFR